MKRNVRKAQIFSMIAVLMSALFILLFSSVTHVALDNDVPITKNEVLRVDNFIVDLEYFMDTTIDRVSYDVLLFTVSNLNTTTHYPVYASVFTSCFQSSIFDNGTDNRNCSWSGENISFEQRIKSIISNASDIYNISITYEFEDVTFRQYDAYAIEVNATMIFDIVRPEMAWRVPLKRSRIVDFSGITDPVTVGTPYERKIYYAPLGGDLFRAGDVGGNVTTILDYINQGYYYRDSTGLSFLDLLEGRNLTNTSGVRPLGINAFVPVFNRTGSPLYKGNQTTATLYQYTSDLTFTNPSLLVRFNKTTGINTSLIFNKLYVLNTLKVNDTSILLAVDNCCDASGCDPDCGDS